MISMRVAVVLLASMEDSDGDRDYNSYLGSG
jgi:hypothetical protein